MVKKISVNMLLFLKKVYLRDFYNIFLSRYSVYIMHFFLGAIS